MWKITFIFGLARDNVPSLNRISTPVCHSPSPSLFLSLRLYMHIVLRAIILSEMHSPMRSAAERVAAVRARAHARNSRIKVSFRNNAT